MSRGRTSRISYRTQIYEALREEIRSGRRAPGAKTPSLRSLAARFKASVFPVRHAMARLEAEGYVIRRHGSGVYVQHRPPEFRMTDSAMLCMDATGHVFSDLAALLHERLHDLGLFASVLDVAHGDAHDLLRRAQYSEARFIILHAGRYFPFAALDPKALAHKHLIAVITWESPLFLDRVHRVLVDHVAGSAAMIRHLWSGDHRHVLLAGPDDMLACSGSWDGRGPCPITLNVPGAGFAGRWRRRGGRVTTLVCTHDRADGRPACDAERLLAVMNGRQAPSAVVGFRDVDAWDVREILRRRQPETLDRLSFVGYGDTPWSQTSHPPFTTQNWNLTEVADVTQEIIRDIEAGKVFKKPITRLIAPLLVIR